MRAYEFIREQITAPWVVPDEEQDSTGRSIEDINAEIAQLDRQLKYITPVDQQVDAGNGDKILKNISPRDVEKREKGINLNPEIQRMPWTGNSGATRQMMPSYDIKRGYQT